MKRILLAAAVLLWASLFASGQRRVFLEKEYEPLLSRDIFVIVSDGKISEYAFQFKNTDLEGWKDSLFVVMDKAECARMRKALREFRLKYREWRYAARSNGVTNYSRPFEIDFPPVTIQRIPYDKRFGLWGTWEENLQTAQKVKFEPVFEVSRDGGPSACCYLTIPSADGDSTGYKIRLNLWAYCSIFLKACNTDRLDKMYQDRQPKPKEFYDSIFK